MNATPAINVQLDLNMVPRPTSTRDEEGSFERSLIQAESSRLADDSAEPRARVDSRNPEPPTRETPPSGHTARTSTLNAREGQTTSRDGMADIPGRNVTGDQLAPTSKGSGLPSTGIRPSSVSPSLLGESSGSAAGESASRLGSGPALSTLGGLGGTALANPHTTTASQHAGAAKQTNSSNEAPTSVARVGVDAPNGTKLGPRLTRLGPSPRTYDARAIELAERARDSIFKQIALKLTPGGGHMLVRLDPPELGQLDVSLLVENGSLVRLTLGAERPEVASMLERHLPELKQLLADQGLSVDGAEVFTRDFASGQQNNSDGEPLTFTDEADPETSQSLNTRILNQAGYMTAEGVDFWV